VEKEIERLAKKALHLEEEIQKVKGRVSNQDFLNRAPQEVVEKEKERLGALLAEKERLDILRAGMQ